MNENKVSEGRIRELIENSEKNVTTIFDKVTVVSLKLPNGFVITESSGCVDPENYDEKTGESICMGKIEDRLWELEGYLLQNKLCEEASEKDIDKFKIKVEPGESPFDCLGREFFSLARDKFKIHRYDDPEKLYAFKLSGNLWTIKHDEMISLIETDCIEETMVKLSHGRDYIINYGTKEICTQEIDLKKFELFFEEGVNAYKMRHCKNPRVVILSEKVFPVISKTCDYIRTGLQSQFKGIKIVFSADIEDVYGMFIF